MYFLFNDDNFSRINITGTSSSFTPIFFITFSQILDSDVSQYGNNITSFLIRSIAFS